MTDHPSMPKLAPLPDWPERLTVAETAAYLRVKPKTIYRLVKAGELTCIRRPMCHILIPREAIAEYENRYLCPAKPKAQGSAGSPAGARIMSGGPILRVVEARSAARTRKTRRKPRRG